MFVIVSYDIVDDKNRTKIAKKMCNYGSRIQYSVFECNINKTQYKEMKKQLKKFIDPEKDSIRFFRLCGECKRNVESLGIKKGYVPEKDEAIIV